MIKTILSILLIGVLFNCCRVSKTDKRVTNKYQLLEQAKSGEGLKRYLHGSWNITYLEEKIVGREIQTFEDDSIIFIKYDEQDIIEYSYGKKIEYYDNYGISSYMEDYSDTLKFLIVSVDSFWTVIWGDYPIFYSRISDDE